MIIAFGVIELNNRAFLCSILHNFPLHSDGKFHEVCRSSLKYFTNVLFNYKASVGRKELNRISEWKLEIFTFNLDSKIKLVCNRKGFTFMNYEYEWTSLFMSLHFIAACDCNIAFQGVRLSPSHNVIICMHMETGRFGKWKINEEQTLARELWLLSSNPNIYYSL